MAATSAEFEGHKHIERLYLGTQGWSYDSWVGSFYPSGTRPEGYLEHYARHFNTVELDTTFYAVPRLSTVSGWRERTPESFRFAAKFPKIITHEKQLRDCGPETIAFLETMTQLGQKLGSLLLQMPPSFSADQIDTLEAFLQTLPVGFRYAVEIRHRSWLAPATKTRLLELLRRQGVALCLVQHQWMPRLDDLTTDYVYVRWLGRREDIPDDDFSAVRLDRERQLDVWAEQLSTYLRKGVTVYGYFNDHYQGHSPASVRGLQKRLAVEGE
jgi:uncharacterized protein YecE (DUF72 family)